MSEFVVYLNGRMVPESEAHVSIFDMAVVLGATITEMTRTFKHKPFRLEEHMTRLFRSAKYIRLDIGMSKEELGAVTRQVAEQNARLIDPEFELGIINFITGGEFHEYVGSAGRAPRTKPTICVHSFPLPYHYFAKKIQYGAHAVTPPTHHIPPQCIDPKMKCRSRMHYYIAEKEAAQVDPEAICLMLDLDGNVTETSGSNFLILDRGTIVSPLRSHILPGISRGTVIDLAAKLGIPFVERSIQVHDVMNADEALSVSTPYCIMPVTRINGATIGDGKPGPVYRRLAEAWSELVGVDIVKQFIEGADKTRRAREAMQAQ